MMVTLTSRRQLAAGGSFEAINVSDVSQWHMWLARSVVTERVPNTTARAQHGRLHRCSDRSSCPSTRYSDRAGCRHCQSGSCEVCVTNSRPRSSSRATHNRGCRRRARRWYCHSARLPTDRLGRYGSYMSRCTVLPTPAAAHGSACATTAPN